MLARSTTFAGEWPPGSGVHWTPGEVRTVADDADLPDGIDPVFHTGGFIDPEPA